MKNKNEFLKPHTKARITPLFPSTLLGFTGEMMPVDCGCTIVQKTHLYPQDHTKEEDSDGRAILIIRNPYQALVSFRHFETSGQGHTQVASADQFTGPGKNQEAFIYSIKEIRTMSLISSRTGDLLNKNVAEQFLLSPSVLFLPSEAIA